MLVKSTEVEEVLSRDTTKTTYSMKAPNQEVEHSRIERDTTLIK